VLVNIDEGNNEGVCDDMEKIVTPHPSQKPVPTITKGQVLPSVCISHTNHLTSLLIALPII
jgi:hypothetical protein